jgi:hypothetical protein
MLVGGLLVPMHLRAVDASVIAKAGRNGPALLEQGQALAALGRLGAAQLLAQGAQRAGVAGWDRLAESVTNQALQHPAALMWGDDARLEKLFNAPATEAGPATDFLVRPENREAALAYLQSSPVPVVQELLRCRALNGTVLFPPSSSASGQAFDTAVSECGLLLDGGHLSAGLSGAISSLAATANGGGNSEPLELVLMDFMSLGERLDWDQLSAFVAQVPDAATLRALTIQARGAGAQLPVLFAAVQLSGKPAAVGQYLADFKQTGMADLAASLHFGAGGVGELAERDQRLYHSSLEHRVAALNPFGGFFYFAAGLSFTKPWLALAAKWFSYMACGFLLAVSAHLARPAVSELERPLQVRGFHFFREFLFSLGFLLVVLLLSEPFLAQESQKGSFSLRPHLPMSGAAVSAGIAGIKQTVMNPTILLTLLLFFVLQSLLYLACLVKLAEIRRQAMPPRMKLKLLENEDHLFDAGLYLGFVGTIVSLIVASLGMVKFSLMAAYSSTSFGIIYVCVFKIFHLRPARRKLLLEAELADVYAPTVAPAATLPS